VRLIGLLLDKCTILSQALLKMSNNLIIVGKSLPPLKTLEAKADKRSDWISADPQKIRNSLQKVLQKPSGNWYVIGGKEKLCSKERREVHFVNGKELLLIKNEEQFCCISNFCPHMGAPLSIGRFDAGRVTCAWHGLSLDCCSPHTGSHLPLYDDGYLLWVQLPSNEPSSEKPYLGDRPRQGIAAVYQKVLRCSPEQVIQNRLDPWHGAHFHPHTFARLWVYKETEEALFLRVAYRVWKRFCIEVDAQFHCPDPRTIVMTILEGEGQGSVVETHATPIAPGYTLLTELTIAQSSRPGFQMARKMAFLIRPFMVRSMARLWKEDAAYAERRYYLENDAPYQLHVEKGHLVGDPKEVSRYL
jgi:nitrite reductase/ring-hydroxylating ferredoxin subunit